MQIPDIRLLTRATLVIWLAASCQAAALAQDSLMPVTSTTAGETHARAIDTSTIGAKAIPIHTDEQPAPASIAPPSAAQPSTAPPSIAQPSIAPPSATQPGTAPPTPPEDTTAIEQESKDAEQQLDNSPPAGTRLQLLPRTGKIITSREQKRAAAAESMRILSHGPELKIPAFTESGRPTICLALGGGGIRGAAHIGVIRVLERAGIPIDCIVGNSMGAIVGGLYSAGVPLDRIEEMLADGDLKRAYANMVPPKVMITPIEMLLNPLHKHYAGLYTGKRFGKWLDSVLPEENMNVQDTKIPFCAVATNLIDGQAYKISEGRLSTVIKASSSLAPLLRPVPLGDKLYMDGGLRANLPAKAARETGAGFVLGVLVDEPLGKVAPKTFMHLRKLTARMVDIVLATADEKQLQFADVVINPDVSGIAVLSKHRSDVEKAVKNGELAAEKALPNIRQQLNRLSSSLASETSKIR